MACPAPSFSLRIPHGDVGTEVVPEFVLSLSLSLSFNRTGASLGASDWSWQARSKAAGFENLGLTGGEIRGGVRPAGMGPLNHPKTCSAPAPQHDGTLQPSAEPPAPPDGRFGPEGTLRNPDGRIAHTGEWDG